MDNNFSLWFFLWVNITDLHHKASFFITYQKIMLNYTYYQTCRPKTAGSLCRAADYECDLPEYCTGESEYCPTDIYKMDTEDCDGGKVH